VYHDTQVTALPDVTSDDQS